MQSSWGDFSCVDQQLLELSLAQQQQGNQQQQPGQPAAGAPAAAASGGLARRAPSIDCGVGPLHTVLLPLSLLPSLVKPQSLHDTLSCRSGTERQRTIHSMPCTIHYGWLSSCFCSSLMRSWLSPCTGSLGNCACWQ